MLYQANSANNPTKVLGQWQGRMLYRVSRKRMLYFEVPVACSVFTKVPEQRRGCR